VGDGMDVTLEAFGTAGREQADVTKSWHAN
jgi:hypothetical protein